MSVYQDKRRVDRWTFDFELGGERHSGYCVDPESGKDARNRTEAREIESAIKRAARQRIGLKKSGIKTGSYTIGQAAALHMMRLKGTGQSHVDNNTLYVAEILDYFEAPTPIAEIPAEKIEGYRSFAAGQFLKIWIGGPDKARKRDRSNPRFWKTTTKVRSARRTNYYLKCLRSIFGIAHETRGPHTGQSILPFPIKVKLFAEPKRDPRPIPDSELDARMAKAPSWTRESAELARLFGLRGGEALSVEIRHIDHDERELFFPAGETKGNKDERPSGGDEGYELLCRLEAQARARGQTRLVTWPGPKHWRAFLRGEEVPADAWCGLKSINGSWRTSAKAAGVTSPHRLHDVRARFVTEVARVADGATQAAARHQDPATTAKYIKFADDEVRDAVRKAMAQRRRPRLAVIK